MSLSQLAHGQAVTLDSKLSRLVLGDITNKQITLSHPEIMLPRGRAPFRQTTSGTSTVTDNPMEAQGKAGLR